MGSEGALNPILDVGQTFRYGAGLTAASRFVRVFFGLERLAAPSIGMNLWQTPE
jgi:hypothetical protein